MAKIGRPTKYSEKIAHEICRRIWDGESLLKICKDEEMPNRSTVGDWVLKHEDFANNYARARMGLADYYHDQIIEIGDDSSLDTYIDSNGEERTNHENIQRSRLRCDNRKWIIARMNRSKYGDNVPVDNNEKPKKPIIQLVFGEKPNNDK